MNTEIRIHSVPRNPFRPGMGLEPPYLADRLDQIERFGRFLDGFPDFPRNLRLTGLRGVGKTVLLQRYADTAMQRGWVVVSREWSEHLRDERAFAMALVVDCRMAAEQSARTRHLKAAAVSAIDRALDRLGGLSVSLAGITVALRPSQQRERAPALEDELFEAVASACRAVTTAGGRGIVLCYDEAHVVRDSLAALQLPLSTLLAVTARLQREGVPLMLVVCGLPTLTENLARAKSYSERMFQAEELDRLRSPEDGLAFTLPLQAAGRDHDPELAIAVAAASRGYAFFIQFFGALLWESSGWPSRLTESDYHRCRPSMLEALDRAFFDARLARTSTMERRLLQSIATCGEAAPIKQVIGDLRMSNSVTQRLIYRLADKGLVYRPERGIVAFAVPLFGDYLRRAQPEAS
jgi:AAA ATPase domain